MATCSKMAVAFFCCKTKRSLSTSWLREVEAVEVARDQVREAVVVVREDIKQGSSV